MKLSLHYFLKCNINFSFLDPNIILSNFFSNTFILHLYLREENQVSYHIKQPIIFRFIPFIL
jgi:hypothetical protein